MNGQSPAYISALAGQMGSLSAFLGGFAATYLATLLALGHRGRADSYAIGGAAVSAVAFIVAVVASMLLVAAYHEAAPPELTTFLPVGAARNLMSLAVGLGIYGLLFSLGASGWPRSRRTGWFTTSVAGVGMLIVTWLVANFR